MGFMLLGCAQTPTVATSSKNGEFSVNLSRDEATRIGKKIWVNECSGTVAGLTSWNSGEHFASLGIGHFIWYPKNQSGRFDESWPKFVDFLKARRISMPQWVATTEDCPWNSLAEFEAAQNAPQMQQLRQFLVETFDAQTDFIVARLEAALPKMKAAAASPAEAAKIERNFYAVAQTPNGTYGLIDYVNFKGEGTKSTERYRGEGWGMMQVLLEMKGSPSGQQAAVEYSEAAKRVLTRRVANAKPKDESEWLDGWKNRVDTYKRSI